MDSLAETPSAPKRSFEQVWGWGGAVAAPSRVLRPTDIEGLRKVLADCRRDGVSLGLRGGGNSYGDASVNAEGRVLDIGRMGQILDFDSESGVAELEPGVTISDLWRHLVPRGHWPKVVSGTMFPTVAGAAAMNIHGKNNFKVGTFGEAVQEFDLMLPNGEVVTASPTLEPDLYHAAIGGFGMLGIFTRMRLASTKVHSGNLEVRAHTSANLAEMMATFEERREAADYLVGWVDCFGKGSGSGRGLIHEARYLNPGEDSDVERTLTVEHQELPPNIMGVFPKSQMWRFLRPICNDLGMPRLNALKHQMGRREARHAPTRQAHAAFAFLLDYVPGWKRAYGPGGLIQYQSFLPKETAHDVYTELLERNRKRGIVPYLGVFKRHRPDPFLLTHAVDGWSFAMDFRVTASKRQALWEHCAELTEIVLAGGGRFYFAKDLVLGTGAVERMYPEGHLERFLELKRRVDPEGLLQTNLWRRLFGS